MPYDKQTWTDGETFHGADATRIEDGLEAAASTADVAAATAGSALTTAGAAQAALGTKLDMDTVIEALGDFHSGLRVALDALYGGGADVTAPTVPTGLTTSDITVNDLTATWSASTDAVGVTGYEVRADSGSEAFSTATTSFTFTWLVPDTEYVWQVRARDLAGNFSAWATVSSPPTTLALVDTDPPTVPTGLNTTSITSAGFTANWTASTDNVGVAGYEVRANSSSTPVVVGGTSYAFAGLSAGTSYSWQVRAYDDAGNFSSYATVGAAAVTGTPAGTPPGVPTGLTTSAVTSTGFTATWTASTGTPTGYEVRADSAATAVTVSSGVTYAFTGLTPLTSYAWQVRARNAAGEWSAFATVGTAAVTTGVAPNITTLELGALAVGVSTTQTLVASGSTPITWARITGALPDGLALSGAGDLSGTPTTAASYSFTVSATNSTGSDTQAYTGTVGAAPAAPQIVTITTTGATFDPLIALAGGSTATVNWSWAGGSTTGLTPNIDFGSAATRTVSMTVTTAGGVDAITDVRQFNLGYDYEGDSSRDSAPAIYERTPSAVTGVGNVKAMTGLVYFLAGRILGSAGPSTAQITGTIDFTGMSNLTNIECFAQRVTGVNLTGCSSLIRLCLEANRCPTLDLNPVRTTLRDLRSAVQGGTTTLTFTPLTGPMTQLWHYCIRDRTTVNHFSMANMPVLEQLWDWNCGQGGTLDLNHSATLQEVLAYNNPWDAVINFGPATKKVDLTNAGPTHMTTAAVDAVFIAVNALGTTGASLKIGGTNQGPSSASAAARAALTSRGWALTHNTPV